MKKVVRLLALSLLTALVACPVPVVPPLDSSVQTGSLSLAITHAAPWLQSFIGTQGKALLYATQVQVQIRNSAGADVITPVTQTVAITGQGGSGTLSTITGIPTGSNYTLTVSIFNSAVSLTVPVVSGQASVAIYNNQTTNATVTCYPAGATAIAAGTGPWAPSLALESEAWYSVPFTALGVYTISQATEGIGTFLFNASGLYVATISPGVPYVYACSSSGTYYIGLAATSAGTAALDVTVAPFNEGSVAAPVPVTLDTTRTFKIGKYNSGQTYSYYTFTTAEAGTYYLDCDLTTSSSLDIALFSNSAYTSPVGSQASYSPYGAAFSGLSGSTTYYLRLFNNGSSSNFSFPGRVVSPTGAAADFDGEGSVSNPTALTLGAPHAGGVGSHFYDQYSYYTFTTGAGVDSTVTFTGSSMDLYAAIYSNSTFTAFVMSSYPYGSSWTMNPVLSPNTTYYLRVYNEKMYSDVSQSFAVTVALGSATLTPLSVSATWTTGALSPSTPMIWYEVPVTAGQSYAVQWDDAYQGSGTYTVMTTVAGYHANRYSSYFSTSYGGYTTPAVVAVPAGESTLYVKVVPYSSGSTGTFAIRVVPAQGSLNVTVR